MGTVAGARAIAVELGRLRSFTRLEYDRLGFFDNERLALNQGRIVEKCPQRDPHASADECQDGYGPSSPPQFTPATR